MSKRLIISLSAASLLVLASCQKDEFQEMYEEQNAQPASQAVTDQDLDRSVRGVAIVTYNEAIEQAANHEHVGQNEDIVIISIKEVSDGDDEADSGDDSKSSE